MRILLLSFYFQPDLSAGSFRNSALAQTLLRHMPENSHIDVITTLPNRYATFSTSAPEFEEVPGLSIYRIALPSHQSGMLDQSKAFLTYAFNSLALVKNKEYDLIYASSSRLMTAALSAWVARRKQLPLYLDIRDIFVDTCKDVISKKLVWLVNPIFSLVERWTISRADTVNLVSEGFHSYFKQRYPDQMFKFFTNGIDEEFLQAQPMTAISVKRAIVEVVYAGNIGEGQGLHNIIPKLAKRFEGKLLFKVIGDGGRREQLISNVESLNCANVQFLSPVTRSELIEIYRSADILFLHLNDYDAFKKVLPSKIFEYGAMGKPIWAGVGGYSVEFIKKNISNTAVFPPCKDDIAAEVFNTLVLTTSPRNSFVDGYSRANIMNCMALDIIRVAEGS